MIPSENLFVSFSGGETSGYLAQWAKKNLCDRYKQIVFGFANTGEENEETLIFADQCDQHFGLDLVWLEARVIHGERIGTGFTRVNFKSASRNGEPFEEVIKKYGIPNTKFKHCTRELKERPLTAYAASLGWDFWDTGIGIRVDEFDRISPTAKQRRIIYPLVAPEPMTKAGINTFWREQPFRLQLKGYQGNCKWCWKKSFRKHFTLIREKPEIYDFPRRMEVKYSRVGPEFSKDPPPREDYERTFFRGNLSVESLFEASAACNSFVPAEDDAVVFDEQLDLGLGCHESCEVFTDETEAEPIGGSRG